MRLLTWDNIELVSISRATGVTFGVILALLLLLCFCGGIALGWRKVSQNPNHHPKTLTLTPTPTLTLPRSTCCPTAPTPTTCGGGCAVPARGTA